MPSSRDIADQEIIIRRVRRNDPNCTQPLPGGGCRATKFAIRNRRTEVGSSFSCLLETSPRRLCELVEAQSLEPNEFTVCRLRVAEVRKLGLDVIHLPTDDDPGHCEIRETAQQKFTDSVWSQLAKCTRILTDEEIASLSAGDTLVE